MSEAHPPLTDNQRMGINWVSSLMGHHELGADSDGFKKMAGAVTDLDKEGLLAASRHVELCLGTIGQTVAGSLLPDDEKCAYRLKRMAALAAALNIVWDQIETG